ncbi:MAG: SDR family NAD(P)-dependent oxidoreductase [Verrucomicrobia bacterium]|nr:SDR family NAD(P)-dependent oxidoreductase [Verrucomicrobiota bacterium]
MTDASGIALVTGARRSIGRHLAEHLLATGYKVVGASRQQAEWKAEGYHDIPTDITDEAEVGRLMKAVRSLDGSIEVVINNAAVSSMNAALLTPGSSVKQMMDTNLVGTFLVCREAAKLMRRNSYGRIVNLSSVAVPLRLQGQAAYVASKSAVESLTQVLAREFYSYGITVNALSLPPIDTGMTRGVPKEKLKQLTDSLPVDRMGSLEDVTHALDFLISKNSGSITGQILSLGGL